MKICREFGQWSGLRHLWEVVEQFVRHEAMCFWAAGIFSQFHENPEWGWSTCGPQVNSICDPWVKKSRLPSFSPLRPTETDSAFEQDPCKLTNIWEMMDWKNLELNRAGRAESESPLRLLALGQKRGGSCGCWLHDWRNEGNGWTHSQWLL